MIDKDLAAELLARDLDADLFMMVTDADAVYVDWGKPTAEGDPARRRPPRCAAMPSRPARWGRRSEAACHFIAATGKSAAIGALADSQDHRRRGRHDDIG